MRGGSKKVEMDKVSAIIDPSAFSAFWLCIFVKLGFAHNFWLYRITVVLVFAWVERNRYVR